MTAKESIGIPERKGFPLLKGKEAMIEAEYLGAKGHAYTDEPGDFRGTVSDVLSLAPDSNHKRAILVATLNAVLRKEGTAERTVHCRDGEPETCARALREQVASKYETLKIAFVGYQPAMIASLSAAFPLRVLDMDPDNIGKVKSWALVEGPDGRKPRSPGSVGGDGQGLQRPLIRQGVCGKKTPVPFRRFLSCLTIKGRGIAMVQVEGLRHAYSREGPPALDGISFEIGKGETFGFLGPSGAGKSTTQGILTGLLSVQDGSVSVMGHDMRKPSRSMFNGIGVSFEQSNVYGKLTARENLDFYRSLFDVPTMDPGELLAMVGLDHVAGKRAGEFSKGMKHRLTFARSMINRPALWFLDEPTTGLDPSIAATIKDIVKARKAEGTTVFLTTHNMQIADELCDRVAFIVDGKIRLVDSPRNLKLRYGQKLVQVDWRDGAELRTERLSFVDEGDRRRLKEIVDSLKVETMHTLEATLEQIFVKVTGRGLE